MSLPAEEAAGPSTSGQQPSSPFSSSSPLPPSPAKREEEKEKVKPLPRVKRIGPTRFLEIDRGFRAERIDKRLDEAHKVQYRVVERLEAEAPWSRAEKQHATSMLQEMTKKLRLLEAATFAGRSAASSQGAVILGLLGRTRPPEEKLPELLPTRMKLGRKGIDPSMSSLTTPKLEAATSKPQRTPVVPIRKPLNQPQTETPQLLAAIMEREMKTERATLNGIGSYSHNLQINNVILNNEDDHRNDDDSPPTPPVAINKGKRRAASSLGLIPGIVTALTAPLTAEEKPEKRPKREGSIKKRMSGRLSTKPKLNIKDEDEPTYCVCSRVSFGEMIGCDNDKCEIEWFHFECIGLTTKPKGKWFCPMCRHPDSAKMPRTAPLPKIIKELKREINVPEM